MNHTPYKILLLCRGVIFAGQRQLKYGVDCQRSKEFCKKHRRKDGTEKLPPADILVDDPNSFYHLLTVVSSYSISLEVSKAL